MNNNPELSHPQWQTKNILYENFLFAVISDVPQHRRLIRTLKTHNFLPRKESNGF